MVGELDLARFYRLCSSEQLHPNAQCCLSFYCSSLGPCTVFPLPGLPYLVLLWRDYVQGLMSQACVIRYTRLKPKASIRLASPKAWEGHLCQPLLLNIILEVLSGRTQLGRMCNIYLMISSYRGGTQFLSIGHIR